MTQNDVMQLLIGKSTGAVPTTAVNGIITDYSKLAAGELVVVNAHHKVLSATSVLTDDVVKEHGIKFLLRNGTDLIQSDLIRQENIRTVKGVADAAGVEQVSYIGYNSSSGSIEVANSKLYVVRLVLKETDVTGFGQEMILNAPYKSDSTATQLEIANGLALALANTLNRQPVKPISAKLISNVAYASTASFDNGAVIVTGATVITLSTARTYNTGTALALGDYVRISDAPTVTGCDTDDGIYKVVELIDSPAYTFRIDRPVEETGFTSTQGKRNFTVLTAAKMAAANLGLKLKGVARPFTAGKFNYSKVEFTIGLDSSSSFGSTPVSYTTKMSLGQGNYEQIAQLEWNLLGNDGNPYPGDFMWTAARALATSGKTYDQVSIQYFSDHATEGIGAGAVRRPKQLLLAMETGFTNGHACDIVLDVIEQYTYQTTGIAV